MYGLRMLFLGMDCMLKKVGGERQTQKEAGIYVRGMDTKCMCLIGHLNDKKSESPA